MVQTNGPWCRCGAEKHADVGHGCDLSLSHTLLPSGLDRVSILEGGGRTPPIKALLTCLLLCPLFPRMKSQSKGVAGPGLLAHVSLGHIPGKSLLTLCLSGQGRCSDRRMPPWHHIEGNSEAEQRLAELTQQGPVAETQE